MSISDIKHKDKRVLIPSNEEAGFEKENPVVKDKILREYPKNPIVHRGQDPELFWLGKYGEDEQDDTLNVDIRSLYRHEHISPKTLIDSLYRFKKPAVDDILEIFGNGIQLYEEDKTPEYYKHKDNWSNRLILGDSLLVMNSLLEREGLAGQVQMIYIDPPYGVKYGSNWQIKINSRAVTDGKDEHLSGEAEQIKAYRDTWELGIHSYLSYLRERLLIARELLTESGSCFVQISDDNVHLVRCLMDEILGSENFVNEIAFSKTAGGLETVCGLPSRYDYILWFAKKKDSLKFRKLYEKRDDDIDAGYNLLMMKSGEVRSVTKEERASTDLIPQDAKLFRSDSLTKPGPGSKYKIKIDGIEYNSGNRWWGTTKDSIEKLYKIGRIRVFGKTLRFIKYLSDFPLKPINNIWMGYSGAKNPKYVVQTNDNIVARCMIMSTDPGDLIFDPTCGSGTTAYVAEQWGRRWITVDTSRIALNIAKTRLMTATYPYYQLHDENDLDIRQGFQYKTVPHITLKSLANDEEPEIETLYDQPLEDRKRFRVSGPFTVETMQSLDILPIEQFGRDTLTEDEFLQRVKEQLKTSGIINGLKQQRAKFTRLDDLSGPYLHMAGFYNTEKGESKAYIHLGPKFSTVSKAAVNEAIKECRQRGDADWLIILFFSIEDTVENGQIDNTKSMGGFELTKVRMQDDLMQDGLLKKDRKAASFVTIGEPDISVKKSADSVTIKIEGIDIYDPIKDEVSVRDAHDIAYWMVDDEYDGSNFIVRQIFFCGGDKEEFNKWRSKLDNMASESARKKANHTLKIEIDEEAWDRLYGMESHPIPIVKGVPKKIAVRVISQFGEECTKVIEAY